MCFFTSVALSIIYGSAETQLSPEYYLIICYWTSNVLLETIILPSKSYFPLPLFSFSTLYTRRLFLLWIAKSSHQKDKCDNISRQFHVTEIAHGIAGNHVGQYKNIKRQI